MGEPGIKFDGDLSNGTIVNHRAEGRWTVSFRPNPDGSRRRAYSDPYVVARVIITREHQIGDEIAGDVRDVNGPDLIDQDFGFSSGDDDFWPKHGRLGAG